MIKGILLLIFVLLISIYSKGQIRYHHIVDAEKIEKKYGFILQSVQETSPTSGAPGPPAVTVVNLCVPRKGVVSITNGMIKFDLWQITDSITCGPNPIDRHTALTTLRFSENRKSFGEETKVMWIPFRAISVGVNTLPFRIRGAATQNNGTTRVPATATSSFALAVSGGYSIGWSQFTTRNMVNWSVTVGAYAGPSTVELNKATVQNPGTWTDNRTNASLSYGLNLVFARNNLGLVVAVGGEHALGTNNRQWIYNHVPYLGFGINTSSLK